MPIRQLPIWWALKIPISRGARGAGHRVDERLEIVASPPGAEAPRQRLHLLRTGRLVQTDHLLEATAEVGDVELDR